MTVEGSVQLPRAPSPTVIVLLLCSLVAAASKSATFDNHQSTRTGTPPPPLPTSYSERFARWAWPAAAIMTADLEVINDCFINNKTFTKWQPLTTDCDGPVCRAAIGRTTTGTQGMVFVVVQGTVDFWELYNQLVDSQLVDLTIGGTTYGQVHQYYLDVAKLFYAQLSQLMDDYGEPGDLLIFLGHSMAGIVSDVLSTLFALDYGYPADLIRLYTFGAPEGADLIYSINHFSHTFGQSYQVLHIGDPIPKAYQVWAPAFVSSPWLILYRTRQMLPNQTRTCDFQDMAQCVDYPTDWDTDSHLCYFTVRQGVHACEGQLNCDLPRLESGSAIPETSDSFKSLFAMLSVVEKRPDVNLLPELKARVHVSGDILKAIANAWHVESAVEVDFEAHDCPSANSDAMCVSIRVVSTGNLMAFNKDFYNATGSNRFECPINVFVEALRNLLISDELRR